MPLQKGIIPLSELPLRNDFMFGEVMRTEDICQLFLEELLGLDIRHIEFIDKQKELSDSYTHHGIRLDVYLKDDVGTVFIAIFKKANNKRKRQTNAGNPAVKQNQVPYEPRQGASPDFGPSIHEGGPSSWTTSSQWDSDRDCRVEGTVGLV